MKKLMMVLFTSMLLLGGTVPNSGVLAEVEVEKNSIESDGTHVWGSYYSDKYKLYLSSYSYLSYEEFELLYDMYSEAYGVQTVPNEVNYITSNTTFRAASNIKDEIDGKGYTDFFYSTSWKQRDDGITLSIDWRDYLHDNKGNGNVTMYKAARAWRLIKDRQSSSSNWKNGASMEAQWHCHVIYVGRAKNPYNLEPWRTETNMVTVVAKGCNP